jgi:hypothetical protein
VRVENAGHGLLGASLLLGGLSQRLLALFKVQVVHVVTGKLLDLNEKVPQVLLERGQVLIKIEEALDYDSDLSTLKREKIYIEKTLQNL